MNKAAMAKIIIKEEEETAILKRKDMIIAREAARAL